MLDMCRTDRGMSAAQNCVNPMILLATLYTSGHVCEVNRMRRAKRGKEVVVQEKGTDDDNEDDDDNKKDDENHADEDGDEGEMDEGVQEGTRRL